MSIFDYGID